MPGSTDITITVKVGDKAVKTVIPESAYLAAKAANRDLIMSTVEMLSKELNRNL